MKQHISAGVVVIENNKVLLLYREKSNSWHLPKGTLKENESLEEAAKRETLEETGFDVKIGNYLGILESEFERDGKKVAKTTHYFFGTLTSKEQKAHDEEHDKVEFVELSEAIDKLGKSRIFENEEKLLKKLLQ